MSSALFVLKELWEFIEIMPDTVPISSRSELIARITTKSAVIGVYGLGYTGLPLALRFSESGYRVIGFDVNSEKVALLNRGESYIKLIHPDQIKAAKSGGFTVTCDYEKTNDVDVIILCLPTPLTADNEPDLSYVLCALDSLKPHLRISQLLSLESTTFPGTTDEIVKNYLVGLGMDIGENFFLCYSPEREDPGNQSYSTHSIPKICSGTTAACLEVATELYKSAIEQVIPVSSTQTAEMVKLIENVQRAVNVALINEIKMLSDKIGVDIYEAVEAAATKPFGFTPYFPGPGIGGHCIPIDPLYLSWKSRQLDIPMRLIDAAHEINSEMPKWVVDKLISALLTEGKLLCDADVMILGVSYKKNIDDVRESPALEIISTLLELGANVSFSDPFNESIKVQNPRACTLVSQDVCSEYVRKQDAIVLVTDHDDFDYDLLIEHSSLIIDSRGKLSRHHNNVVRA